MLVRSSVPKKGLGNTATCFYTYSSFTKRKTKNYQNTVNCMYLITDNTVSPAIFSTNESSKRPCLRQYCTHIKCKYKE